MGALSLLAITGILLQAPAPQIPIRPGLVVVQAVEDPERGDYEATIAFAHVAADAVTIRGAAFVKDDAGVQRWLRVRRTQLPADLREARTQILGFHTDDPVTLSATTALGPSVAVVEELRDRGTSDVVIRNYASRRDNAGALTRQSDDPAPFPVLVNGRRVMLPAIHARGQLGVPGSMRPWELYILDHPLHPLTLKVTYGAEGAADGSPAEWSRQIVRIDSPEDSAVESELTEDCRVRVPGIYFEFDSDVLNPASDPRVGWIADLLRRKPDWILTIEGHTDNVGTARYNLDLSGRRAAALKRALVERHGIADTRIETEGFGFSRPLEPNATPEGRARNRRVELVRACADRTASTVTGQLVER